MNIFIILLEKATPQASFHLEFFYVFSIIFYLLPGACWETLIFLSTYLRHDTMVEKTTHQQDIDIFHCDVDNNSLRYMCRHNGYNVFFLKPSIHQLAIFPTQNSGKIYTNQNCHFSKGFFTNHMK